MEFDAQIFAGTRKESRRLMDMDADCNSKGYRIQKVKLIARIIHMKDAKTKKRCLTNVNVDIVFLFKKFFWSLNTLFFCKFYTKQSVNIVMSHVISFL